MGVFIMATENESKTSENESIESKTTELKVRIFTDMPKNYVLVGRNKITKNVKIYKSPLACVHMPWFESIYKDMADKSEKWGIQKFQLGVDGLEAETELSIWWRIRQDEAADDMGFASRWASFILGFTGVEPSEYKDEEQDLKDREQDLNDRVNDLKKRIRNYNKSTSKSDSVKQQLLAEQKLLKDEQKALSVDKKEFNSRRKKAKKQRKKIRFSRWASMLLLAVLTILGFSTIGAISIIVPILTLSYVSFFHQDQEWVKKQGEYKCFMQEHMGISQLKDTIVSEVGSYYAKLNPDAIKNIKINLNSPDFASLKKELDSFSEDYGIEVFKIVPSPANLTAESDALLRRKKEADAKNYEIKAEADAELYRAQQEEQIKKIRQDRFLDLFESAKARGMSEEAASGWAQHQMNTEAEGTRFFNYGSGGPSPIFGFDAGQHNNGSSENTSEEKAKQKTK